MLDLYALKDALITIKNDARKGSIAENQAIYWLAKVEEAIEDQELRTPDRRGGEE